MLQHLKNPNGKYLQGLKMYSTQCTCSDCKTVTIRLAIINWGNQLMTILRRITNHHTYASTQHEQQTGSSIGFLLILIYASYDSSLSDPAACVCVCACAFVCVCVCTCACFNGIYEGKAEDIKFLDNCRLVPHQHRLLHAWTGRWFLRRHRSDLTRFLLTWRTSQVLPKTPKNWLWN